MKVYHILAKQSRETLRYDMELNHKKHAFEVRVGNFVGFIINLDRGQKQIRESEGYTRQIRN